jgi:phage gp37-like protein
MILVTLRTAIIDAIATALPQLKEVKAHGGRFSLEELKAIAARSPSVRVACLGVARILPGAACVTAETVWGVFVIAGAAAQQSRDAAALALVAAIAPLVPLSTWGLETQVNGAEEVRGDNLFSRDIDRQGVAMWAITFRHTVDLNPVDVATLDDFLLLHVDYDHNQDDSVDMTDDVVFDGP